MIYNALFISDSYWRVLDFSLPFNITTSHLLCWITLNGHTEYFLLAIFFFLFCLQSENERNYHIFYQMCACADQPQFKSLRLCECVCCLRLSSPNGYLIATVHMHLKKRFWYIYDAHVKYFFIVKMQVGADKFNYTCMGGEMEIQGVDDRADMAETCRTFTLLGRSCTLSSVLQHDFISYVSLTLSSSTLAPTE